MMRAQWGMIAGSSDTSSKPCPRPCFDPTSWLRSELFHPPALPNHPVVLRLIALRMVEEDEHSRPLAEAALDRQGETLH